MSDFPNMRARAGQLIDRLLNQLEEKSDDLTSQDSAMIEKAVKTILLLTEAEERDGKANPNKGTSTEDLEDEFD